MWNGTRVKLKCTLTLISNITTFIKNLWEFTKNSAEKIMLTADFKLQISNTYFYLATWNIWSAKLQVVAMQHLDTHS